jgi:hypothetical protein
MPYKFQTDKTLLPRDKDRRVKLTDVQREQIKENIEGLSQRKLADKYGVSRRMIAFIVDPSKLEENKKRREERGGWKQYYNKEEHTFATREHRHYKQKIMQSEQSIFELVSEMKQSADAILEL